jgi:hypothetical protein
MHQLSIEIFQQNVKAVPAVHTANSTTKFHNISYIVVFSIWSAVINEKQRNFIFRLRQRTMTGTKRAEATGTRPWFLKLWYAYHYWYADHCLLTQRDLNKKSKYK